MAITAQRLTYDDWLALPDDGRQYELRNGALVEMPPPTVNHQLVVSALLQWLGRAESAGHGTVLASPVAVLFDPTTRRQNAPQPDVFFVRREREHIIRADVVAGVPDLVIEILSPKTREDDLPDGDKWQLYQDFAVPHYWIVDPGLRLVTQHAYADGAFGPAARRPAGDTLSSPLFPTVTLPIASLFRRLRPA